ncbi:hypothetical protein [Atopomonas sediminilitoris]|uniref:hypothetical protein n=1 Tax=Atopomonas sediminilitoris TaxID=2919919 RepID=UPI001F4D9D5E|nr:hypothetical protein [Atopomonas sediminilitoris]MCJ8170097.1 hypothetical protein [Atopomonas sediminilitoris]
MSIQILKTDWEKLLQVLADARSQQHVLTYRAVIERVGLPRPAMKVLTAALEHLAKLDADAERPLRSALVVSQGASRLPRIGFFQHVSELGLLEGEPDGLEAASWHSAEIARVYAYDYASTP